MQGMSRRGDCRGLASVLILAAACVCWLSVLSGDAEAVFPGTNGRIALSADDGSGSQIWTVEPDGSSPIKLTTGPISYQPTYSADGSLIAFNREGGVVVMNADGSGLVQLIAGSEASKHETTWRANYEDSWSSEVVPWVKIETFSVMEREFDAPSFSPDGSQLVVAERASDEVEEEICAVEGEGEEECIEGDGSYLSHGYRCAHCYSHIVTISSATGAVTGSLTPPIDGLFDEEPAYSSGGKIAYSQVAPGTAGTGLFMINYPGAESLPVTMGHRDYAPEFSPDGTRLAYIGKDERVASTVVSGGPVAMLPVPPPTPGTEGVYTASPAYSPDGRQLAFTVVRIKSAAPNEQALYTAAVDGSSPHKLAEGLDAAWQPIPIPPPVVKSTAKSRRGKIRLDRKHRAKIGTVTCGSFPCLLNVSLAKLRVGKRKCGAKAGVANELATGASTKVNASLRGRCLAGLESTGRGRLTVKVTSASASGTESFTFNVTLVSGK